MLFYFIKRIKMFNIPRTCTNVYSIFGVKLMYVKTPIIDRLWYFQK